MDSVHHVDLTRAEAPGEQVLDPARGEVSSQLAVPRSSPPLQSSTETPRRSSKGGYMTSNQIRLNPTKASRDPSPSTSFHDTRAESLELGKIDGIANVVILQLADEGFGAWSYVASAFAMFIVVWGRFLVFQYSPVSFLTLLRLIEPNRFSASLSCISNFPIIRRCCETLRFFNFAAACARNSRY